MKRKNRQPMSPVRQAKRNSKKAAPPEVKTEQLKIETDGIQVRIINVPVPCRQLLRPRGGSNG